MQSDPLYTEHYRTVAMALAGHPVNLSGIPGDIFNQLVISNGIAPLLAYQQAQGKATGIDGETTKALTERSRRQAAQDLVLNNDTRKLLEQFAETGLRCLALTGTPLSLLAYPESYLRERCDTDLYIAEKDIEAVTHVLRDAGYTIHGQGERPGVSKQCQASIRSFQGLHSKFDIHFRLSNRVLFRRTLPFEACWETRQPVAALGDAAFTLSNIDLLIHACIHRIAHGRNTERDRLIWLFDIHLLAERMNEEEQALFRERAAQKRVGVLCADALKVTREIFGTAVSPDLIAALEENYRDEPSAKLVHASRIRWAVSDVASARGLKTRLGLVKEFLFR